jgi:hypothetical protein
MTGRANSVEARALVARLAAQGKALQGREILAPLLPGGRIRTRLGKLVYEFRPRGEFVGWGRFRPVNERQAEPVGAALPWQRGAYLELFPALRVVLLWPDAAGGAASRWLALPFNESDARQRFGLPAGEPLAVHLCDPTDGAAPFERAIARVDGRTLWFDGPDPLADPTHADWLRAAAEEPEPPARWLAGLAGSERLALLFQQVRACEQADAAAGHSAAPPGLSVQAREAWLRRRAAGRTLEGRLRHALAKADATLHRYVELPGADGMPPALVVEWSERGQTRRYRSTVGADLAVVSSGICLSDRDGDFDLTSLVGVMRDAPGWA